MYGAALIFVGCASSPISDFDGAVLPSPSDDGGVTSMDGGQDLLLDASAEDAPSSDMDTGTPAQDAEVPDAAPGDASADADGAGPASDAMAQDTGAPDATTCTDGDGDGTCDFADNCPAVANAGQADADGDGVGDACDSTPEPCTAQAPPSSVSTGDAVLSAVRINGGQNTATVAAGAKVEIALDYVFGRCGLLSRDDARFIVTGVEGNRNGTCHALSAPNCPDGASGSAALSIDAPAAPGTYYIVARGEQNRNCSSDLDRPARIAALCVR